MSVKAGKVLTIGNGFLIDRLQSTGPSSLNFPEERILETGNELAVATVRDTPELSFDLESLDTSIETEAILCNIDETSLVDGDVLTFAQAKPLDIVSPHKGPGTSKESVRGVIIPHLTLESASYRFGVRANATQTFSLRGDSQYTVPGTPYREVFTGVGPYTLANAPIVVVEKGEDVYAVAVTVYRADGSFERLFHLSDYTNDALGTVTLTAEGQTKVGATDTVAISYGSTVSDEWLQTVHPLPAVKPAAVRGKDIDLYIATDEGVGQTLVRWAGVQSVDINWRANLEVEEELGNPHSVGNDYDVPEVSGSIAMRPATTAYLFDRIAQIANVPTTEIAGLLSSTPLELQIRINHPETGARLKTFRVPDARIKAPAIQARVNQKLEPSFEWTSDSGLLEVIKGAPV